MSRRLLTLAAVAALAGAPLGMAGGESVEVLRRDPAPEPKLNRGARRLRSRGQKHPAGAKLLLQWFKAKHGVKAESLDEARRWYAGYLKDKDAEVRKRDEQRKLDRIARRFPWLAHRLPQAA